MRIAQTEYMREMMPRECICCLRAFGIGMRSLRFPGCPSYIYTTNILKKAPSLTRASPHYMTASSWTRSSPPCAIASSPLSPTPSSGACTRSVRFASSRRANCVWRAFRLRVFCFPRDTNGWRGHTSNYASGWRPSYRPRTYLLLWRDTRPANRAYIRGMCLPWLNCVWLNEQDGSFWADCMWKR